MDDKKINELSEEEQKSLQEEFKKINNLAQAAKINLTSVKEQLKTLKNSTSDQDIKDIISSLTSNFTSLTSQAEKLAGKTNKGFTSKEETKAIKQSAAKLYSAQASLDSQINAVSSLLESGGLSDEEIEKMVKDAEANKEADKKKRESVDVRNQADTLIHSTDKNLKEHGSKVSEADKKAIEDASSQLKEALKGENTDDIKKKTEALVQASMKLGEAIYKSQQNTKPDSNKDDGKDDKGKKEDNVVDADFEEVKDENKEKSA